LRATRRSSRCATLPRAPPGASAGPCAPGEVTPPRRRRAQADAVEVKDAEAAAEVLMQRLAKAKGATLATKEELDAETKRFDDAHAALAATKKQERALKRAEGTDRLVYALTHDDSKISEGERAQLCQARPRPRQRPRQRGGRCRAREPRRGSGLAGRRGAGAQGLTRGRGAGLHVRALLLSPRRSGESTVRGRDGGYRRGRRHPRPRGGVRRGCGGGAGQARARARVAALADSE